MPIKLNVFSDFAATNSMFLMRMVIVQTNTSNPKMNNHQKLAIKIGLYNFSLHGIRKY
jgi:hypothetical protein